MSPPDDTPWDLGSFAAPGGPQDAAPGTDRDHPFDAENPHRYTHRGDLGTGGMGTVDRVRDTRLGRDVARKRALPVPGAVERLAQEAWITAQLDHPGIIGVLGAGRDETGQLYYTMRLVRGRTLRAALDETTDLDARLSLLRPLRDACEAVGYAHREGFVHRDLKPENIMVGAFGEVQVVDWGLARPVAGPSGDRWRAHMPGPDHDAAVEGTAVGTPRYMSPEQARGQPVDARADVWSLGVILYELLGGGPPFTADEPAALLHQLQHDDPPDLLARRPDLPPPLAAIVNRSLARSPDDRYPDAKALADDLSQWLQGLRVHAYTYSAEELIRQALHAARVPLTVGILALSVGLAGTLIFALRAAEGERAADAANDRAQHHLQRAIIGQAIVAAERRDRASAELLATEALIIGEDPDARGVLAAWPFDPRPRVVAHLPAPACLVTELDPTGTWLGCLHAGGAALWHTSPLTRRWDLPLGPVNNIGVGQDGGVALFAAGQTHLYDQSGDLQAIVPPVEGRLFPQPGGQQVLATNQGLIATGTGVDLRWPPVSDRPNEVFVSPCGTALTVVGTTRYVGCDGQIIVDSRPLSDATAPLSLRQVLPLPSADRIGSPTRISVSDDTIWVGTHEGVLLRLDRDTEAVVWEVPMGIGNLRSMALSPDHKLLAASAERGGVQVFDAQTGRRITALPPQPNPALVGFSADGLLTVAGAEVERVALGTPGAGHRWDLSTGVTDVEFSPDGTRVAIARGGGWSVRAWPSGELLSEQTTSCVVKDVDWVTGDRLAIALAVPHCVPGIIATLLVQHPDGSVIPVPGSRSGARRVVALGAHELVWLEYGASGPMSKRMEGTGPPSPVTQPDGAPHHIENTPNGGVLVWTDTTGVWTFRQGDRQPRRVWEAPGLVPVAVDRRGTLALTASGTEVMVVDLATGTLRWSTPQLDEAPPDAAVSPDGRWGAVSSRDGTARIYHMKTGELRATLRGHTEQIAAIAFSADSHYLMTGSWDDSVRVWDVGVLAADPIALKQELTDAWNLDLERLLQLR